MSGLETAIRNALDRSDRSDAQTRARIYQSARQALDAGLRRQGVTDALIIMQQQKRLEDKIREIEKEEVDRLAQAAQEPVLPEDAMALGAASREPAEAQSAHDAVLEEGATRDVRPDAGPRLDGPVLEPTDRLDAPGEAPSDEAPALLLEPTSTRQTRSAGSARLAGSAKNLDVPPERAAKPRKRRGFLSHLLTWMVTLLVVAGACWWFYNSGMVQSVMQEAIQAADRAARDQAAKSGNAGFDPRGGFSADWAEVFKPADADRLTLGSAATAKAVAGSEGPAVRISATDPARAGDVVLELPPALLQQMAGKTSTVALTIQSGANQAAQLSVSCDFGNLGGCSRHRFTATQERLEALFSVTLGTSAGSNAGRLVLNAGIGGAENAILLYAVRILPGQ